jgi:hypothetical protein
MRSQGRIATLILLILASALATSAQSGMRSSQPPIHGIWNPVIGQGAVYEFSSKDGGKRNMEMAVLGKDSVDGKDAYWFQMVIDSPEAGGQMVMKHLVVLDGQETHTSKTIMQFPGKPPMEMSGQMGQHQHSKQAVDIKSEAQDLGSESVTVPAGTFTCEHFRMNDGSGDAWVAKNVPPYGLVKYQGKDTTMVLVKVVTAAKDKIVGKPVPFNPQMFMQPPQ